MNEPSPPGDAPAAGEDVAMDEAWTPESGTDTEQSQDGRPKPTPTPTPTPTPGSVLPQPKLPLTLLIVWFSALACRYEAPRDKPGVRRKKILKTSVQARLFLEAAVAMYLRECFWQPGEPVVGNNDYYGNGEAGFVHGLPLIILFQAFPVLCRPMVDAIIGPYRKFFLRNYAFWAYLSAFFDGDGSICGQLGGKLAWPMIVFAIKGANELKALIKHVYPVFTSDSDGAKAFMHRLIAEPVIFAALEHFTVLKNTQIVYAILLCTVARVGELIGGRTRGEAVSISTGIHQIPAATMAKVMLGYLLSFLNKVHGTSISAVEFSRRLWSVAKFGMTSAVKASKDPHEFTFPMALLLYIAGLFGSDGSVGITGKTHSGMCVLCQSNLPYLEAMASILNRLFDLHGVDQLRVKPDTSMTGTPRHLAKYLIEFDETQFHRLMFTVGLLDYNRGPQWILTLALRCVDEDETLDEQAKEKTLAFLKDMLVWIKEARPS